ncbi:MAG: DUF445 family protein [Vulcanibacillus sp.]
MYYIIFAVLIGILIGAYTNHLAIKMLFRPYRAWKIGAWQVPFTPGLIPKRKEEISKRLGLIVENYLFTATGMKEFVSKTNLKDKLFIKLMGDIGKYKEKDNKLGDELSAIFKQDWQAGIRNYKDKKISDILKNEEFRSKSLANLLSKETLNNMDDKFGYLSEYVISLIKNYLLTLEGKLKVKLLINQLFNQSGKFSFLAGLFIDIDQINEKTLLYLNKLLEEDGTLKAVNKFMLEWWDKAKEEPLGIHLDKFEDTLKNEIDNFLNKGLDYLNSTSTNELITRFEENKILENVYDIAVDLLIENLDKLFEYLSISEVVEAEVNNFSTEYFEKMILEISGRELKMITYFGGIIGGLIGLLQGILYTFF